MPNKNDETLQKLKDIKKTNPRNNEIESFNSQIKRHRDSLISFIKCMTVASFTLTVLMVLNNVLAGWLNNSNAKLPIEIIVGVITGTFAESIGFITIIAKGLWKQR